VDNACALDLLCVLGALQELSSCQDLLLALHSTLVTGWGHTAAPPAAARAWQQQLTMALLEWRTALLAAAQPGQPPVAGKGGPSPEQEAAAHQPPPGEGTQDGGVSLGDGSGALTQDPAGLGLAGVERHPTWLRGAALVLVDHVPALLPVARDTRQALAQVKGEDALGKGRGRWRRVGGDGE
jgi:hypothetical protein